MQRSTEKIAARYVSVNFKRRNRARDAKTKSACTRPLFPAARTILDATCDVEYFPSAENASRQNLLRRLKDKEGLVCLLTDAVNEELLRNAPKLRIVSNVAVGFDNIDVAACTKRAVVATNTPGVLDETTADFAWTLMMAVARRLSEGEALARSGKWTGWDLDQLVRHRRLGQDAGHRGFRSHRPSYGAARQRVSDESDLPRCSARGRRRNRIESGISRLEFPAGGIRFCERTCAADSGNPRHVQWSKIFSHEADSHPDQHFARAGGG